MKLNRDKRCCGLGHRLCSATAQPAGGDYIGLLRTTPITDTYVLVTTGYESAIPALKTSRRIIPRLIQYKKNNPQASKPTIHSSPPLHSSFPIREIRQFLLLCFKDGSLVLRRFRTTDTSAIVTTEGFKYVCGTIIFKPLTRFKHSEGLHPDSVKCELLQPGKSRGPYNTYSSLIYIAVLERGECVLYKVQLCRAQST